MPTTAKGLPYPASSDVPDVPTDILDLATAIDLRLPTAYNLQTVSVSISASTSGAVAVTFPGGLFTGAPRVFCQPVATTNYVASVSAVSSAGCTVTLRHIDNTSATAGPFSVYVLALVA